MELRWEICIDCLDPEALAPFWTELLGYERGQTWGPYIDLVDPTGKRPTILLQRVPESKQVKNRLHLDIYTHQAEEAVAKALALGATAQGERVHSSQGTGWFQVLLDPAGNEFCICTET